MRLFFLFLSVFIVFQPAFAQSVECDNALIQSAYELAVRTVQNNTRNGILAAGADYGGEWTRDISINSWNGVSLLDPTLAENSLWSVTLHRDTIGHQYWDKILWVVAAYHHYLSTGNEAFLRQAYECSENTMKELEEKAFHPEMGLFAGPSVFNDGIAGYPAPVYDDRIESSYVLDHPNSGSIYCLSTNCVYYGAYRALEQMAAATGRKQEAGGYAARAEGLRQNILRRLYDPQQHRFSYFMDGSGKRYPYQEGLGISFAVIFGILSGEQAAALIRDAEVSPFGIASIYPCFPRYSPEKPGRHNTIIWPMVNGFFAKAARITGNDSVFAFELFNLAHLAMDPDKGNGDFREIYHPFTGLPDGGWQLGSHWESCHHQTWSATAFMDMILYGVAGLRVTSKGVSFEPFLPAGIRHLELTGIHCRDALLTIRISGQGSTLRTLLLDGNPLPGHTLPAGLQGPHQVTLTLE